MKKLIIISTLIIAFVISSLSIYYQILQKSSYEVKEFSECIDIGDGTIKHIITKQWVRYYPKNN